VSPDCIEYSEQQCNEGRHVSLGNEAPGSKSNATKPSLIKQHDEFVVSRRSVAGKMFGGKPQQRCDCPIPDVIDVQCQAEKTATNWIIWMAPELFSEGHRVFNPKIVATRGSYEDKGLESRLPVSLPWGCSEGAFRHLRALQDIASESGGNRAAGTLGYDRSAEYVAERLKEAGYLVHFEEFEFPFFEERVPPVLLVRFPDGRHRAIFPGGSPEATRRAFNKRFLLG
jgi:hypothetical protein